MGSLPNRCFLHIESTSVHRVTLEDHNPRAQRVVRTIERFIDTFIDRTDSEHATNVLYDNETIRATRLGDEYGQKPERFVVEELITGVADALGYDYRTQPVGFDGLEGRYPDFTVLNADAAVIGEIKKPNNIDQARSESFEYLELAGARPLVGIATDGFTWIKHTANEGEEPEYTKHVALRSVFKDIARERDNERSPRRSRPELRGRCEELANEFSIYKL